jgi:hypothetical protein
LRQCQIDSYAVNISPALPNPAGLPESRDRQVIGAVRPANRARDALDGDARQVPPRQVDQVEREKLAAQSASVTRHQDTGSLHVNRALAAYADVAGDDERSSLRDLLGFDAYA